ncbi:MAG TPA: hypothetical protein VJ738_07295 [Steroidobacteraceae bacterium]|nr:hypothetical protein [Steroidobacteraceae bacterium]
MRRRTITLLGPASSLTRMAGRASALWPLALGPRGWMVLLSIIFVVSCSSSGESPSSAAKADATETSEASGTQPSGIVEVNADVQRALHLSVSSLSAVTAAQTLAGFGRVLDPEPLAASMSEWRTARAAAKASEEELLRVKTLLRQDTASMRALQAATAAAARDRLQAQAIHDRIELTWGLALASRADLPALIQALVAQRRLLVRIDLPAGAALPAEPRRARLSAPADPKETVEAGYLGPAPTTDPELQGRGFLFLTHGNPLRLAVGAAVSASLELGGEALHGVFLPESAVLLDEGNTWVYVQRGSTRFVRTPVSLGPPLPGGWLVESGLHPKDRVVTEGAQLLLSQELKPETQLAD